MRDIACLVLTAAVIHSSAPCIAEGGGAAAGGFVVPRGPHAVATVDVTLRDTARNKDMELRVRVPKDGPAAPESGFPAIVFSHGAGGSNDTFAMTQEQWASHGFVTIAVTHADSIALRRREGGEGAARLLTPEGRQRLYREVDLGGRVADCAFLAEQTPAVADAVRSAGGPTFRIDADRLAVGGHSAGAFTAQLCAGVKARGVGVGRAGLGFVSIRVARFKAAIVISGQGTTSRMLADESWSDVSVPMLVVTGSQDHAPPNMGSETPQTRQHPFTKSRGVSAGGPPAYLLFIEGATHGSYSGRAMSVLGERPETDPEQIRDAVASAGTLFLKAHLAQDAEARRSLDSPALGECIPGKTRYERK